MKGATGLVVLAGFFKLHTTVNHIDYIDAVEQIINKGLRNQSSHGRYKL